MSDLTSENERETLPFCMSSSAFFSLPCHSDVQNQLSFKRTLTVLRHCKNVRYSRRGTTMKFFGFEYGNVCGIVCKAIFLCYFKNNKSKLRINHKFAIPQISHFFVELHDHKRALRDGGIEARLPNNLIHDQRLMIME